MAVLKNGRREGSHAVVLRGKIIVVGILSLFTLSLPGCKTSREIALSDRNLILSQITNLLNAIADGESPREAKPKLRKLMVRFREVSHQLDKMGPLAWGEKDERGARYRQEFRDAVPRCRMAMAKAMSDHEAARTIGEIIQEEFPGFPEPR